MPDTFNPPPGWPKPPPGWTPPAGWTPDPAWPPPPDGWDFWVERGEQQAAGQSAAPEGFTPPGIGYVANPGAMPAQSAPVAAEAQSGGAVPGLVNVEEKPHRRFPAGALVISIVAALVVGGAGGFVVGAYVLPQKSTVVAGGSASPSASASAKPTPTNSAIASTPRKIDRPDTILLPGRTAKLGDIDVTLNKTNKDATDDVLEMNSWSTIPGDRVAILVPVTLKNNGSEPIRISQFLIDYVGGSNTDYATDFQSYCPLNYPDKFTDADLRKGESSTGNMCAVVPKNDVDDGFWKVRKIGITEGLYFAAE